ncbi:MAG: nucleotidyltransferase domain-containing protein [Chloroflexi bacterium]|nr:MAG: nucleotidyltransferase domain-containing protein [Chloroflexota bacterium]
MPTALDVTPEEMAAYRATARRRWERQQQERARRRERAWKVARRAAALLKEQYDAKRVMLFGSLVRGDRFYARSDVDLAVWGLDERLYYRVVSHLLDLDPTIEVDLVMAEDAPPALLEAIEREGMTL